MRMTICDDALEIGRRAAKELLNRSKAALSEKRRCHVALSGGSTPKYLFEELAKQAKVDREVLSLLQNVNWFFSDERFVPHTDTQSNCWVASESLFSKINLDTKSIFPVPTENTSPELSAQNYEATIRSVVGGEEPTFDLIFLGMGDDGHTASLFPGTDLVTKIVDGKSDRSSLVASLWVQKANMHRITFMPRLINHARLVVIMASGAQKAKTLARVLAGTIDPKQLPIQLVHPRPGQLRWLVDRAASLQPTSDF